MRLARDPAGAAMEALRGPEIARAARLACLIEASVPKPGNVSPQARFADTTYADLVASAGAIAPALAEAGQRGVGETVLRAVRDTRRVAASNTNLGIVLLLAPLAKAAAWGGTWKRRRTRTRRLPAPVISVGNITMGGTGKSPFVLLLAGHLRAAGRRPGILTRGYRRHTPDKYLALAAGQSAPRELTGDEPQIFLRAGTAAIGIGPDRHRAGRLLQDLAGVFILDDGFQHARLHRDLDIVLIDALDPFGGCRLFPAGRLREPLEALSRAGLLVITRSDYGHSVGAIQRNLRRYNPSAPILHARVRPLAWVECATGAEIGLALPPGAAAAFCGLGNPQSFWSTLASLGIAPVDRVAFEDHHLYRPHELRRMAQQFRAVGAGLVLTTEKDSLNLPPEAVSLLAPMGLYWLRVGVTVEPEEELLALLRRATSSA